MYSPQPDIQFVIKGYSASRDGAPVYYQAFSDTHCTYPQRDGQAKFTWVAGYISRLFARQKTVTSPISVHNIQLSAPK